MTFRSWHQHVGTTMLAAAQLCMRQRSDGLGMVPTLSAERPSVLAHRRLLANPSYYDLEGTDSDSLNAFLSVLVEDTLADLEVGFFDLINTLVLPG